MTISERISEAKNKCEDWLVDPKERALACRILNLLFEIFKGFEEKPEPEEKIEVGDWVKYERSYEFKVFEIDRGCVRFTPEVDIFWIPLEDVKLLRKRKEGE